MAGKPKNFQVISNVLPTYNFVDIASATGYINFYAGNTVDKYLLSNFTYYSDDVSTINAVATGTVYTLAHDLDFDIVLNRPMDIRGTAIVNVPIRVYNSSYNCGGYVNVKVRKWDGVTETDIVSNDSSETLYLNGYYMLAVDLTIPLTHFKLGETLRLTVLGYIKCTNAGAAASMEIGNDPKSRSAGFDTSGAVPSNLMFQCPVRLNL